MIRYSIIVLAIIGTAATAIAAITPDAATADAIAAGLSDLPEGARVLRARFPGA